MADLLVFGLSRGAPKHYTNLPRSKKRYLAIRTLPNKIQVFVGAEDLNNVAVIEFKNVEANKAFALEYRDMVEFLEDWTDIVTDQL
jgi:hypothetical protein